MVSDEVQGVGKMLPYGHTADALTSGNLLVAVPVGETEMEDALLLSRQVVGNEFVDVCQPLVVCFGIIGKFSVVAVLKGARHMA